MIVWRRFQYQVTTKPVGTPEVVTEDKWHQPWSEPRLAAKKIASFAIAMMASGLVEVIQPPVVAAAVATNTASTSVVFERRLQYQTQTVPVFTPAAEIVTVDKWFEALSEPARQKPGLRAPYHEAFWTAGTSQVTEAFFFETTTALLFRKGFQYPSLQEPIQVTAVPDLDSWYRPFEEPVRLKPNLREGVEQFWGGDTDPLVSFGWAYPWSEPVRTRLFPAVQQQSLAWSSFTPETFKDTKWFTPFSEPVRVKLGLGAWQQQFFQPDSEPQVSFGWIYAWSEPVRQKPGLGAYLQQAFTIDPWLLTQEEQVSEDKWHQGWPDFARAKPGLPAWQQQALAFWPFPISGENVTLDKYWQPFSEPVRQKQGLGARFQQFLAIDPFILTQAEEVTEDRWHQPWSEPVRRTGLKTNLQDDYTAPTFVTEVVTVDKWFGRLSEPVRTKAALAATRQQFFQPDVEPSVSFGWFEPFSEPVRVKPALRTGSQPAFTTDAEPTVPFGWVYPWSEPVRTRYLTAAQQQALAWSAFTPSAVTDIRWFTWLSEPVRVRAALSAAQRPAFTTDTEPAVSFGWSDGLSEPVRLRRFPTAEQSTLAWSSFTPVTVTDIRWFAPLSEPVRRTGFAAHEQPFFAGPVTPLAVVTAASFQETLVHVYFSTYLLYPSLQEPPPRFVPEVTLVSKWFLPLNEPVRQKRGLRADEQQTLAFVKAASFAETVTESRWHQPWSEPVRYRRFAPAFQQSNAFVQPVAQQNITITLGAVETGDIFSGQLQIGFCPQADVSIRTVKPAVAEVSRVVLSQVFAEVSIIVAPQNSDRFTSTAIVTPVLTDAFGNILTDAFGVALTGPPVSVTTTTFVSYGDVEVEVSIITRC